MRTRFREEKTTQAAARLLQLRGGTMSHLKLIKLLYLLDRAALVRWGRPVTYDSYFAMPHGPVLSFTLDRIHEPEVSAGSYWDRYIAPKRNHEVSLRGECPRGQLSAAELELIGEIFERHGHKSRWELRDLTHTLPEWQDPQGSSRRIDPADILRCEGFSEEEIQGVASDLEESALADAVL